VADLIKVPASGYEKLERDVLRWVNMASQIFTFLIPALVYRIYYFKEDRVGASFVPSATFFYFFIITPLWIIGSFPLVEWLYRQNLLLPLPETLLALEKGANETLMALLKMEDGFEFVQNVIVMAAIPALCEEWLFRGVIQKKLVTSLPKPWMGIVLTAIIFSAIHFQFAGFIPRMFLGILLGYLYFFSGNIWIAIWGHFVFNGVQVLSKFLNIQSEEVLPDNLVPNPDVIWVIISALLTTGVFFYFNKLKAK
jgi:membrane protease YdiL (CAAX protease family)